MKKTGIKLLLIGLILTSLVSCGQSRQEKTIAIINKLKLVENQKQHYTFQLEPLKFQAIGNDSIRIIELEKQLSDDKIAKQISLAFDEVFSDSEIDDFYKFMQTDAFDKFLNSAETYKVIASKFKDIDKEIEIITNNFRESSEIKIFEELPKKFEPIFVDKNDGFYATVDYTYSTEDKDIKLENTPSLTSKDISEVKKTYSSYNDKPEISIVFTKNGARKFYILTKENIGKPIAVVIGKHIVSMPTMNAEIMGGKANISGNFSEEEIDKMIETLKEK